MESKAYLLMLALAKQVSRPAQSRATRLSARGVGLRW